MAYAAPWNAPKPRVIDSEHVSMSTPPVTIVVMEPAPKEEPKKESKKVSENKPEDTKVEEPKVEE